MKIIFHKGLKKNQWFSKSIFEQMANIGSEIERTIIWQNKNKKYSQMAFDRALELLDLTILDPKNKFRLKELTRLREILVDYFVFDNLYKSSNKFWHNYFYNFNYAARINC
jgi:hypothetical protein